MNNQMTPKRLQALREVHNVSQAEIAQFLGYTVNGEPNRSMISRFEKGHAKINPRISMLLNSFFQMRSSQ
jgi:transcriptional regulator with XRE-family HTH domain